MSIVPKMGIKGIKKMSDFENFANKIKRKYAKKNCWYLYTFVTMPGHRGKGLGSKLMKPMLEYLDKNNQDCYLETLKEVNVGIYEKYGFELMKTVEFPNTDLTLYAMLRSAKKKEIEHEEENTK